VCKQYYPKDAEDIKQEFLTVKVLTRYLSIHALRGKGSLRAFVRRVLTSCARDWFSKNGLRGQDGLHFTHIDPEVVNRLPAPGMTPATAYAYTRARALLHERLEQLRSRFEEDEFEELIACLIDANDSAKAIGLRLGKTEVNVRQRHLLLRKEIRQQNEALTRAGEEDLREAIEHAIAVKG
jgi:DNA-directed RNA polymerase specialized sigma24 family protein